MDNERDNAWLKSMGVSAEESPRSQEWQLSRKRAEVGEELSATHAALDRVVKLDLENVQLRADIRELKQERNVLMGVMLGLVFVVSYAAREFCKAS
jgi:hypothetical protein